MDKREVLKVLVGSYAHGLATPESDCDYRGVYVVPTSELLSLNAGKVKGTHWVEGEDQDSTAYELGHFLHLATKCNPSILEVFMAPRVDITPAWMPCCEDCDLPEVRAEALGTELRELFPYIWNPKGVADAFGGYSLNQRKKFLDNHLGRRWKFAVAYIRVLLQGIELLNTAVFTLKVADSYPWVPLGGGEGSGISWPEYLRAVKTGSVPTGEVIDVAEALRARLADSVDRSPHKHHRPELSKVNDFLLKVRRENW